MSFYSGKDGRLLIDGTAAAKVRNWSYQASLQTLETTTLGDRDRTITSGTRSHSGSCSLFYYASPAIPSVNSASTLLNKLIKAAVDGQGAESEEVTLRLKIDDGSTNGKYIEGECLLTSAQMQMAVGEVLSADISFEFNGAPRELAI